MSAWVVENGHIDALVMAGVAYGLIGPGEDRTNVGRMLLNENVASVNYRYDEAESADEYTFNPIEVPLDLFGLAKSINCYQYQSCEHPGWWDTEAREFCSALLATLLPLMGYVDDLDAMNDPRWVAAPWGIESPLEIAA